MYLFCVESVSLAKFKFNTIILFVAISRHTAGWRATRMSTTPSGSPQASAFRLICSEKVVGRRAALTSRLQSFETELLTQPENSRSDAHQPRAKLVAKAEVIDSATM